MEYISDEDVDKLDESLPVILSLCEAMENLSSSISVLSTPEVKEITFSTDAPAKPESFKKLLNEDDIIKTYVDSLFKL